MTNTISDCVPSTVPLKPGHLILEDLDLKCGSQVGARLVHTPTA